MALSQNTYVYMETMEIAQNKEEKSDKNGNPWILCEHGGKLSKGTLVLCQSDDSQEGHDKRKTDEQWLLWFSHSLSVCARQLLKPPCTERYARWCERTAVRHRLLLDLAWNYCKVPVYRMDMPSWFFCKIRKTCGKSELCCRYRWRIMELLHV